MKLDLWTWTTALLLAAGLSLPAWGDDDDDDDDEEHREEHRDGHGEEHRDGGGEDTVAPVTDAATAQECGSCHLAYPPGLLPARSWVAIMGGLTDHYGDDASLPPEQVQAITAWLVANAADTHPGSQVSARIVRSLDPRAVPLRILEVPWLRHEHDELPARLVAENPQVRTLSSCGACHPGAAEGAFDEDAVRVPGAGRWED